MKRGLVDFFVHGERFKREFRKQLKTFFVVSAGFTIAFTWRQTIFDASEKLVQLIINIQSSSVLSILTSMFTTIISLLIMFVAIYLLKEPDKY